MHRSILLKTLFEKRWATLMWWLAMFVFTIMVVTLFPTFQESFGKTLQDVPESMKAFLGSAEDYQTLVDYIDLQVFAQMIFLPVILAAIVCTGLIAGEESDGTLQSLLAQPVSRGRVYVQKLLASFVILGIVTSGMVVAIVVGAVSIGEPVALWRLVQASLVFWLVSCVIGAMAFSLGASTGRRGLSGAIVGIYAFSALMIGSLAETVPALKTVAHGSVFNYFNKPSVLQYGVQWGDACVLLVVLTGVSVAGYVLFCKRDIFAR